MIRPITPTPFTDWCADRLTAALSRKVPVTMGGR